MPEDLIHMTVQTDAGLPQADFDLGAMLLAGLESSPDHCAFRFEGAQLSRSQLRDETLALAARLRDAGIQRGTLVAIEIEHSFELPVAMAAVQVVGACAIPIDTGISTQRRDAIVQDVRPEFILRRVGSADSALPIWVDIEACDFAQREQADPDLAMLVYTSGSSGGPKGVMITKESYVRRMMHILPSMTANEGDIDLAWTPSSFITMVDEIFLPLLCGIPTVLAKPEIRADPRAFAAFIAQEGITTFRITPSLLNLVLHAAPAGALSHVRTVITSGEATSFDLQKRVHSQLDVNLLGFYGATEAPAAAYRVFEPGDTQTNTSICTPQPFVALRIVDADGADVDIGETGEIWIGGCAVARGYFRQPSLTAKKFIALKGKRWFVTGDLGRKLEGGKVEIIGRTDLSEVNINGVRVNLPEVRTAMLQLDGINDAWISAVSPQNGSEPILVGHYIMSHAAPIETDRLTKALAAFVPASAVPRIFDAREQFPLTANGKIDLRQLATDAAALLGPSQTSDETFASEKNSDTAKTGQLIDRVIAMAEKILNVRGLSAQDNFFKAGGNSLLAVHFALALSDELGQELKTTLVFNTSSFADIAHLISNDRCNASSAIRQLRSSESNAGPLLTINASGSFSSLAPHLEGDYGVYNLNIFGLTDDLVDVLDSVTLENMAGRLAKQVIEGFPQGPYRLLAYCQDGCLAVETARVLQKRYNADCHLLLIDTFFLEHRSTLKMLVLRAFDLGPSYYINKLKAKLIKKAPRVGVAPVPLKRTAELMAKSKNDQRLYRRYTDLYTTYRPPSIDCPVNLFVSKEWRHANLSDVRGLAGNRLVVDHVEGMHHNLFGGRAVVSLAKAIDKAMS